MEVIVGLILGAGVKILFGITVLVLLIIIASKKNK